MTFADYINKLGRSPIPGYRRGQEAMNELRTANPKLADHVQSRTHLDPFYDDSLLDQFLTFVGNEWEAFQ